MSSELIVGVAAVILSLLFEYLPGLSTWYNALVDAKQKLIMLGLMALVAVGAFALSCLGRYDFVTCDVPGAWAMLEYFILAVIANQTAHRISP